MFTSFLDLIGIVLAFQVQIGDPCLDVLHALTTDEKLRIVSTNTVNSTLVYTLQDQTGKKSAHLGCEITTP